MKGSPLEDIRIIDLTAAMAGPFCTQLLADFGASVLKIEPSGKGDMLRDFGPPFVKGESWYFLLNNRNKRSMTLNLQHVKGMEIFRKLAKTADIVIENYRPGVKRKLKIDYDDLKKENPRLIYASISGFGQSGPYEDRAGFDPIAQGMWERLAKVVGLEHLTQDKRFLTVADRVANRSELTQLLEKKLSEKTNKEWEAILDKAGVANGPILISMRFLRPSPENAHGNRSSHSRQDQTP